MEHIAQRKKDPNVGRGGRGRGGKVSRALADLLSVGARDSAQVLILEQ